MYALQDLRRNKVRTALTSLGILIGVMSVVLLVALGNGLKNYISGQFESLGTNIMTVLPGKVLQNGSFRSGSSSLGGISFDERDINKLKRISQLEFVIPVFTRTVTLVSGANTHTSDLYATTEEIFEARNLGIEFGKLFTKTDLQKRSKVAVLGPKAAEELFGSADAAVGKSVQVDNQTFRVRGVLASKGGGGFGGPDFDSFIYIPYKSALTFNPDKKFLVILLKAQNEKVVAQAKRSVETVLAGRYDEDTYSVVEQTEILKAITSIFGVLNSVLVVIGAISLIVGGIGIMNIMYVSVVERTKEIGIRRALGATRSNILSQFLTESILLALTGGLGGILLSVLIAIVAGRFFPISITPLSVIIAFGVSSAIGIIFGVFPARKAARLSPLDAIRYE